MQHSSWRIVDIVTASVLAVAFGVVFWAWGLLWAATGPLFIAFAPLQGLMYGVWLLPAVLVPLIIRKPGAALYAELVAAVVSALIGSQWGITVLLYGVAQGLAAELVFALGLYRRWGVTVALIAGGAAGLAAALIDRLLYYPTWTLTWTTVYVATVCISAAVIAGVGSRLLIARLIRSGTLNNFAAAAQ